MERWRRTRASMASSEWTDERARFERSRGCEWWIVGARGRWRWGGHDLWGLNCPIKNNPLIAGDPIVRYMDSDGRWRGNVVPGSNGMYYIDQNCVIHLTEEGLAQQQAENEANTQNFNNSLLGQILDTVKRALETVLPRG